MKTAKKEKHFINKPIYPGGPKALWTFIRSNLRYPEEAFKQKISGVVRLRYTINNKGKVISALVIHSLGYGCDEEAIRVVSMLKYEVPRQRKIKVKFFKNINVRFDFPVHNTMQVTLSEKKEPKKEKEPEQQTGGYEYTITI